MLKEIHMNFISSRFAKRLCAAFVGALLLSGWAVQAHQAQQAPQSHQVPQLHAAHQAPHFGPICPEGSARICTPHGCYCD
jgi:hypothetical protein